MQVSIREDFSGIGMWRHREDLIKRVDHILERLDRGLGYLARHKPDFRRFNIYLAEGQYEELKRVLLEVDRPAMNILTRTPLELIFFGLLILVDTHRISLDLHVRSASPVSIISHLSNLALPPPTNHESTVHRFPPLLLHFLALSLSRSYYGTNLLGRTPWPLESS